MKRLKFFILIFCLALSIPLAYFMLRAYHSIEQEEISELRYFANTLFDQMEEGLAVIVQQEEGRAVDDYTYSSGKPSSSLSQPPSETFILGYLQNNPDGTFQSPMFKDMNKTPAKFRELSSQLKNVNNVFNLKRTTDTEKKKTKQVETASVSTFKKSRNIADKYLDASRSRKKRFYLGRQEKRVEQIPANQVLNVSPKDQRKMLASIPRGPQKQKTETETNHQTGYTANMDSLSSEAKDLSIIWNKEQEDIAAPTVSSPESRTFQVEVDPIQSVFIDENFIFFFRRIVIHNEIYRQGFVVKAQQFLHHLEETYFLNQPMARFTNLKLKILDSSLEADFLHESEKINTSPFYLERTFPRPFSFIQASLACDDIPRSAGRRTLNIMIGLIAGVILMGMFAIYHSARTVVEMSERRSSFVSSVTHELKTPLTNIRMYIEMLEQGIARTPEREHDYFRILVSESGRLSRLINNVLEYSKLEKKQRHADLQEGTFDDVLQEVIDVMQAKINQENFSIEVEKEKIPVFSYDREMMIQVLINLIENSMKFGKKSSNRSIRIRVKSDDKWIKICVSDSGPGIPQHALKKVFHDFYRVDSELVRTTRGTGIGLALVKKLITAMNGKVSAVNNDGPGCTIHLNLPKNGLN